jgi:hypothetical protein
MNNSTYQSSLGFLNSRKVQLEKPTDENLHLCNEWETVSSFYSFTKNVRLSC